MFDLDKLISGPAVVPVTVKGFGDAHVKRLTVADVLRSADYVAPENASQAEKDADNVILRVVLGVCDEHGQPLFTMADFPKLRQLPGYIVMALVKAVDEHNPMPKN